jgi:hypothetical protein
MRQSSFYKIEPNHTCPANQVVWEEEEEEETTHDICIDWTIDADGAIKPPPLIID